MLLVQLVHPTPTPSNISVACAATTLVSIHLVSTAIIGAVVSFATSADNKTVLVPIWELIGFSLVSNGSLISMNISLMLNTVGFYQASHSPTGPTQTQKESGNTVLTMWWCTMMCHRNLLHAKFETAWTPE